MLCRERSLKSFVGVLQALFEGKSFAQWAECLGGRRALSERTTPFMCAVIVGPLHELRSFLASENRLSGPMMAVGAASPTLSQLDMNSNKLTGTIPPWQFL